MAQRKSVMPSSITILFLLVLFFVCLSGSGVYAFGAGDIPSFAYMEGRAFRHGDIEDALAELVKRGSGGGFALASMLSKGSKFNGLDIKRVYFGNWLRDYSQTIINLCMVLGFLAHGYATHEFEVTVERLGVYLPTEHIDNPKGYGAGEDPRKYHPKLRGPVEPIELQVDPRTGMKNYIANDTGHWDTSRALVRRTLEQCIHLGRQHRAQGRKEDEYEAYRLLGQSLHTLEDFPAHSNFCELALVAMGHHDVFLHVGDQARIQAPGGKWVAPLVTGTFGGSDFTHSLLGEAGDHLSQASVSDLNKELDKARSVSNTRSGPGGDTVLRDLLFSLPGGSGTEMSRELESVERIRAGPSQGGKRPEDMSPQELHAVLWQVLSFRDSVMKKISKTIEKIPGLGPLIEKITNSISVFVFTTLEVIPLCVLCGLMLMNFVQPFLKPLLKTATGALSSVSAEAIDNQDQYEVFNDPRADDPTHSFLSKDHFNLILNEPAGHLARIIVIHAVTLIVKAWDDTSVNVHHTIEDILSCLFHPDFHNNSSKLQREMMQYMHTWVNGLGNRKQSILQRLTKNAVRNHENVRRGGEGGVAAAEGTFAASQAHQFQHQVTGYAQGIPGVSQAQSMFGGGHGHQGQGREMPPSGGQAGSPRLARGHRMLPRLARRRRTPPSGPPSSYAPPPGPPSFPGADSGYAPSYAPPPGPPSFPGGPGEYGSPPPGGYGYPGGAPEFPGSPPSFPGGPSPGFPGADPYASQPPPQFPGGPPQFPGAPGGYAPPSGPALWAEWLVNN
ncbi:heterokaryon incompatibility protein HET-C [Mycena metata]|uniref:Heterokaryon incompatibility protein HET-C n=1 Tax=Mycena metata TaxID=1033252 RepID=A0AAD7NWP6_9AGAR|nr:heterokaryon incompatibility protein HET-C [Mycena metata]